VSPIGGPEESAAGEADREVPHEHGLRQGAGVVEARAGRLAALAGADPILLVTAEALRDAIEHLGRLLVLAHPRFGNQPRSAAIAAAHQHSLVADEQHAAFGVANGKRSRPRNCRCTGLYARLIWASIDTVDGLGLRCATFAFRKAPSRVVAAETVAAWGPLPQRKRFVAAPE